MLSRQCRNGMRCNGPGPINGDKRCRNNHTGSGLELYSSQNTGCSETTSVLLYVPGNWIVSSLSARLLPSLRCTISSSTISSPLISDESLAESKERRLIISPFAPFNKLASELPGNEDADRPVVISGISGLEGKWELLDDWVPWVDGGKNDSSDIGTRRMVEVSRAGMLWNLVYSSPSTSETALHALFTWLERRFNSQDWEGEWWNALVELCRLVDDTASSGI